MRRSIALVCGVILTLCAVGPMTNAVAQQGPPEHLTDSFPVEGICEFPVLVELNGKAKTIELPGW